MLKHGKQVVTDKTSYNDFSTKVTKAYKNNQSLNKFEQDLSSIQSLQGASSATTKGDAFSYDFSDESSIEGQYNYNEDYDNLVSNAKDVFPTYYQYLNWKEQADKAHDNKESLDEFSYSLEMFDSLQRAETSPIYQNEVNNLARDSYQFSRFADIAKDLGEDYSSPTYIGTKEFNSALDAVASPYTDTSTVFTSSIGEQAYNVEMPTTNKTILNVQNNIIENSEVLFDSDGKKDITQITTSKEQENKQDMFDKLIQECGSEEEIADVIDAFTPKELPHRDIDDITLPDWDGLADNPRKADNTEILESAQTSFDLVVSFTNNLQSLETDTSIDLQLLEIYRPKLIGGVPQSTNAQKTSSQEDMGLSQ